MRNDFIYTRRISIPGLGGEICLLLGLVFLSALFPIETETDKNNYDLIVTYLDKYLESRHNSTFEKKRSIY